MTKLIPVLLLFLGCGYSNPKNDNNGDEKLQLKSVYQLMMTDTLDFDFSGIVKSKDSIYVVADKPWNTFIYHIDFEAQKWLISKKRTISSDEKFDLEAIDYANGNFYLANEYTGSINILREGESNVEKLPIDFSKMDLDPGSWKNAGWEGLAVDETNEVLYLAKERQPRFILAVDMKNWTLTDQFDIPQTDSNDFSDLKFQDGFLYVLERNGNFVTKINPSTKEVVSKFHYKHIASHPSGKLFEPGKYGMAEALLLTENEIWIGLDNNGLEVSDFARETYNLNDKAPVILIFDRPEGF